MPLVDQRGKIFKIDTPPSYDVKIVASRRTIGKKIDLILFQEFMVSFDFISVCSLCFDLSLQKAASGIHPEW